MDLPKVFKVYLVNQGLSLVTIKNYLSDFNHFWGWLVFKLKSHSSDDNRPQTIIEQIDSQTIAAYKNFLIANKTPTKTVNRRLTTLRHLGEFCLRYGWLKTNPAKEVANLAFEKEVLGKNQEQILNQFKAGLEKEKVSPLTIKNYLSDIRHFLAWIEVET